MTSASGEAAQIQADQSAVFTGPGAGKDTYTLLFKTKERVVDRIRLDALADAAIVSGGPGRRPTGISS